jgi:hypothetical protein
MPHAPNAERPEDAHRPEAAGPNNADAKKPEEPMALTAVLPSAKRKYI